MLRSAPALGVLPGAAAAAVVPGTAGERVVATTASERIPAEPPLSVSLPDPATGPREDHAVFFTVSHPVVSGVGRRAPETES